MPLLSWQLWLAREIVKDNPLPWQKQQTDFPGRVAQGFPALSGNRHPAVDPKPRGKSLVGLKVSRARRELATQWSKRLRQNRKFSEQQSQKSA